MYIDAEFPAQREKSPTVATLKGIPSGREGMIATLREMRTLARQSIRSSAQTVRLTAMELLRGRTGWREQIVALQSFVQDSIQYVRDPVNVELIATPEKTLEFRQGDCDDQATLLAALLESVGHPARFVAIGLNGKTFSHVLVQTKVNSSGNEIKDWVTAETIIKKPLGWFPQGVTSRYILKV